MRRRKGVPFYVTFFAIGLLFSFGGFILGYYRYGGSEIEESPYRYEQQSENTADEGQIHEYNEETNININNEYTDREEDWPASNYENLISNETNIKLKTVYTQCGSTVEERMDLLEAWVGFEESQLKAYLESQQNQQTILSFTTNEVVLMEEKNEVCPAHLNYFLVAEKDGYIVVYHFNERGLKSLIRETRISIATLPPVDQEKLKRGILKKTEREVEQILEDYSS
ncbi:hypothetical protein Amet_2336 [Alkaliphilus metalliredigens QYMF]|uniref:Bypass of forespore C C-terminal domain-containing protein n=1 Tax=Alkaliphilus metalliredigens (strain QYMF) TaxID=293826 RepID=A6TQM2_ALKMQ|nr:BofC C-terminal domain-containing protein [Alkaliphilus metalliredigens]ABR48490.1 hypothetical protein Amet_2336 [Alkaliphilus metalliredigens QYMF]